MEKRIRSGWILVITLFIAALAGSGLTAGTSTSVAVVSSAQAPSEIRCPSARQALVYYKLRWSSWRQFAEKPTARAKASTMPRGCDHVRWAVGRWQDKAILSRASYQEWTRSRFVIRERRTWAAAVQHVQKAYPGTSGWLLSCSADEGGWGHWKPNKDGYPPGGWLQFYHSTWVRMFGLGSYTGAIDDLSKRGFTIRERSVASWYSPVGQALAGAWGVTHGRSGEWAGAGC